MMAIQSDASGVARLVPEATTTFGRLSYFINVVRLAMTAARVGNGFAWNLLTTTDELRRRKGARTFSSMQVFGDRVEGCL